MPKLNKTAVETTKTVVIAILVTGIGAFIGGMQYQERISAQVHAAQVATNPKQ